MLCPRERKHRCSSLFLFLFFFSVEAARCLSSQHEDHTMETAAYLEGAAKALGPAAYGPDDASKKQVEAWLGKIKNGDKAITDVKVSSVSRVSIFWRSDVGAARIAAMEGRSVTQRGADLTMAWPQTGNSSVEVFTVSYQGLVRDRCPGTTSPCFWHLL